ncbi:MAG TPA: BlaI/MecI/CopY family transcriptional regulator [Thermoanaerobaculia bacterium]|nr:BlaI/MecI/CopY family transcriptional regulator [Thermoanaerobaculia bacterium]
MRTKTRTLTEQELEIMKVVWERKASTVRDVYEALRERKGVAYTTVMTMMNILETKGHLVKRPEGRAYVYEPSQAQTQVISGMVQEFVDRVFDGAARPLVLSLLQERKLSREDLEEISRLIDEETPEEPQEEK